MIAQRIVAATLAAALAGCAADNPPQAMGAPPPAVAPAAAPAAAAPPSGAMAGSPVNGAYSGAATVTRNAGRCPGPGSTTWAVRGGTITRHWGPNVIIEAKVQPDGTFSAQSGTVRMVGTLQGGHLESDMTSEYCGYHYSLTRR